MDSVAAAGRAEVAAPVRAAVRVGGREEAEAGRLYLRRPSGEPPEAFFYLGHRGRNFAAREPESAGLRVLVRR